MIFLCIKDSFEYVRPCQNLSVFQSQIKRWEFNDMYCISNQIDDGDWHYCFFYIVCMLPNHLLTLSHRNHILMLVISVQVPKSSFLKIRQNFNTNTSTNTNASNIPYIRPTKDNGWTTLGLPAGSQCRMFSVLNTTFMIKRILEPQKSSVLQARNYAPCSTCRKSNPDSMLDGLLDCDNDTETRLLERCHPI